MGALLAPESLHEGLSPLARIQEVHAMLARVTAERASRDHQVRLAGRRQVGCRVSRPLSLAAERRGPSEGPLGRRSTSGMIRKSAPAHAHPAVFLLHAVQCGLGRQHPYGTKAEPMWPESRMLIRQDTQAEVERPSPVAPISDESCAESIQGMEPEASLAFRAQDGYSTGDESLEDAPER